MLPLQLLKFYTGTTADLAVRTVGLDEYIALDTTTRRIYWKHEGIQYNTSIADWNESDSTQAAYIDNKPPLLTVNQVKQALDINDLSDITKKIISYRQLIDTRTVIQDIQGHFWYNTNNKRRPNEIVAAHTDPPLLYGVQTESLSVTSQTDGSYIYSIDLSRYLAYSNLRQLPTNWYLYYS